MLFFVNDYGSKNNCEFPLSFCLKNYNSLRDHQGSLTSFLIKKDYYVIFFIIFIININLEVNKRNILNTSKVQEQSKTTISIICS